MNVLSLPIPRLSNSALVKLSASLEWCGKRMLSVLVEPSRADAVFEYIYVKAKVDRPMGGIVYMGPLDGATAFLMPEGVQDEDD